VSGQRIIALTAAWRIWATRRCYATRLARVPPETVPKGVRPMIDRNTARKGNARKDGRQ
jgi:hypothetical protein